MSIETMDEANLREWEIPLAALRGARFYLLSWNVACVPAGRPLTKNGACSQTRESVCKNPARSWSEIIAGQFYPCKNSLRQTANWSLRRPRDTGCFQRLHARGSDAWRSCVAAEITSCVVNGSFCVKGRSCAIDVCWEGKQVQSDLLALESRQRDAHMCGEIWRTCARLQRHG